MKIAILTLTEQRDKVVDDRIAKALTDLGHDVGVRNFVQAGMDAVVYEKPDAVVMPMVGSNHKLHFARQCSEWGITTIVRRGEAGAAREVLAGMDPERVKVIVGDFDYKPYVDLELTWGPEFSDILAERGKMPRSKIASCGPFTLDACFDHPRPDHVGKRRILFATAWSGADDVKEYTECGVPTSSPLQGQMYRQHCEGRAAWIEAIKNLVACKSHKYEFTLKVRPGESTAAYIRALPKSVKILPYDYPSSDAIAESDIVVHAGSTMAIESHLMGVPSINFHNCNPDPRLANICPRAEDYGELEELLGRTLYGQSNIDRDGFQWLKEHLYGEIDGRACERAAKAIHKALPKGKNRREPEIPDTWPKTVLFPSEKTSAEPHAGQYALKCFSCKHTFGINKDAEWCVCPFCGLIIRKIVCPKE
jgi:predicted RNA-binding Zn-ribbon protein involved in translation (DUF1610 family)